MNYFFKATSFFESELPSQHKAKGAICAVVFQGTSHTPTPHLAGPNAYEYVVLSQMDKISMLVLVWFPFPKIPHFLPSDFSRG